MAAQDITQQAEKYCHSYAKAVGLGATSPSVSTREICEAIFDHYLQEGFVAFVLGSKTVMGNKQATVPQMTTYLDSWVKHGIGLDIRMDKCRIEFVSSGNALCFITWSVHPPATVSIDGWEWENVYSYRVPPGQESGYWEFSIADNEIMGLLQRFPDFMVGVT